MSFIVVFPLFRLGLSLFFFFSIASSFLHHLSLTRQSLGDFDFQRSNDRKDTSHCVFFFLACYTEARSKVSATRLCLFILISLRSFYIFIRSSAMHYKPTLVFQFPENTFTFFCCCCCFLHIVISCILPHKAPVSIVLEDLAIQRY